MSKNVMVIKNGSDNLYISSYNDNKLEVYDIDKSFINFENIFYKRQRYLVDFCPSKWWEETSDTLANNEERLLAIVNEYFNADYKKINDYVHDTSFVNDLRTILAPYYGELLGYTPTANGIRVVALNSCSAYCLFNYTKYEDTVSRFISCYNYKDVFVPNIWIEIMDDIFNNTPKESSLQEYLDNVVKDYTVFPYKESKIYKKIVEGMNDD